jgi:hypothetical protein
MASVWSEAREAPVVLIVFEEHFDLAKQVFLHLGWHKGPPTRQKLLHKVFEVDPLESFGADDLWSEEGESEI